MNCQKIKKQLVLFVGDDLSERRKRSVEFHLKHCADCVIELEKLKRIQESVHTIAQKDIPTALHPDFPEKVVQQIVREQTVVPQMQAKSLPWFFQNPARIAGIFALAAILTASAVIFLFSPGRVTSDRLIEKILSISERGSSELEWDPEHIFFKAFDGPFRLDSWEAPRQSGVYAVLHKTTSEEGHTTYVIDYCGQGRNLSSYRGYPWIQHRIKRLVAHTGSKENVYIAVFLMPDSSKQERRQIEEALVETFNPYFNRGV
jgi:hypothetical protein